LTGLGGSGKRSKLQDDRNHTDHAERMASGTNEGFEFRFHGSLIAFVAQLRTTEKKGRELNAPCIEAPRSACQTSTPSRARLGACSVGCLTGLGKIRGFRCSPQPKLRKFVVLVTCVLSER
jgi:hypothetical protein